jgi:excisionase family DNA binding protein
MTDSSISTRVASDLLSVHESTIKRWCNAGELDFWTTPGGHRRIPIGRLVAFASEREMSAPILDFGEFAERVWIGMEVAKREENFHILSKLVLEWINLGRSDLLESLLPFLADNGFSLGEAFDHVLGSAMARIGSLYTENKLSVGQEHRMTHHVRDALLGLRHSLHQRRNGSTVDDAQTAVVGCLRGEVHEIGSLMIRQILTSAGWNVVYLGLDVPTEEFVSQAREYDADLICISVSPPRGVPEAGDAINLINHLTSHEDHFRIAVGGALLPDNASIMANGHGESRFFSKTVTFERWLAEI